MLASVGCIDPDVILDCVLSIGPLEPIFVLLSGKEDEMGWSMSVAQPVVDPSKSGSMRTRSNGDGALESAR